MNYVYRDKLVLITGASRGIGLAFARELAEEGAELILTARNRQRLDVAVTYLQPGSRIAMRMYHPTLLVSGGADRITPPDLAELLSRSMEKSRVEVLTDCGHWSPLEAPIAVADLISARVSVH